MLNTFNCANKLNVIHSVNVSWYNQFQYCKLMRETGLLAKGVDQKVRKLMHEHVLPENKSSHLVSSLSAYIINGYFIIICEI